MSLFDLDQALKNIDLHGKLVSNTVMIYDYTVGQAHAPLTNALRASLAEAPRDATEIEVDAALARSIIRIWAAGYAWDPRSKPQRFSDFVDYLVNGTEWVADPRQTSEPDLRNEQELELPVRIILVRN